MLILFKRLVMLSEPPTYEEAMRLLCQAQNMSPTNVIIPEEFEVYQNSTISQSGTVTASDDATSDATITQQPVYNNY